MRRYDANPALSAFTVVIGAFVGVVVGVVVGFSTFGVLVLALMGIAVAGLLASTLGLVGERDRGSAGDDDLPSHYHDY